MFGLGTWELLVILIVMLLLFGSRLPNVMRSLGKSVTEFKKGMNEIGEENSAHTQYHQAPQQPPATQQNTQSPSQPSNSGK